MKHAKHTKKSEKKDDFVSRKDFRKQKKQEKKEKKVQYFEKKLGISQIKNKKPIQNNPAKINPIKHKTISKP